MVDGILVFTNEKTLIHKLQDGKSYEGNYCYWEIRKLPKQKINKIYFAVKGVVKGYFDILEIANFDTINEIRFHSDSWHTIKNGETLKPSQGWRYYDVNNS